MLGQFQIAKGNVTSITLQGISVWDALLFEALAAAHTLADKEEILQIWKKRLSEARFHSHNGFAENRHRGLMRKEFEKILAKGQLNNGNGKNNVTVHY